MNTIKSTLAIAAIAVAVSAPIGSASAGEGPYEINGKTVFEIKREQQAKKAAQMQKQQGTKQASDDDTRQNWFERIFSSTRKSAS